MRPWLAAAAVAVLLIPWCGRLHAEEDKDIYLWKDPRGKTHLTEEPPPEGGSVQERITQAPGPPAATRRPAAGEARENRREHSYERCRLADQARQFAMTSRQEANAMKSRAEDARQEWQDLKTRAGYDEDRLDDFKYDIRRLREKTRWLEDLAKQTDRQADSADIQSRLAQLIAGDGCP